MKSLFAGMAILSIGGWQGTELPKPVEPVKHAPIEYFNDHCSHCHGKNGIYLEAGFATGKTDAEITDEIKEMADGPGQAPLDKDDLPVQLALHRSLSDEAPFAVWTKRKDLQLSGELTPDTELKAFVGPKAIDLKVEDGRWSLNLRQAGDLDDLRLKASKDKKVAILNFKVMPFSAPRKEPGG
jgi:hypothetical protein